MQANDDFLRYYFEELNYLREAGRVFAREHAGVAARLEMHNGETADPHVERLIESFAFLTARLQRQLHAEFPDISNALLSVLYPQLAQPLPPMSIACFDVGAIVKGLTAGFTIPRETPLFAQEPGGLTCRFRTCYDTVLWPLKVAAAEIEPAEHRGIAAGPAVLRIRLEGRPDLLRDPEFTPSLRFFLDGPHAVAGALHELLFAGTIDVLLSDNSSTSPVSIGCSSLKMVGFEAGEGVLPYPANALPGYRLIQEYFNFPRKFHFFDVENLSRRSCAKKDAATTSEYLDLFFVLRDFPRPAPAIGPGNFRLGCTPIVNLFQKTAEPIRLDHYKLEYRIVPDVRREATTEIHSILSVSASANPQEPAQTYEPFYAFRHAWSEREPQTFWLARRVAAERPDMRGTDLYLSFVDLSFNPAEPGDRAVFAHTLCTNRWMAHQLPDRAVLNIENAAPVMSIYCLGKPTPPRYPPLGGAALWRLVSSLSLNYVSLAGEAGGIEALREILRLYALSESTAVEQEIEGISEMHVQKVVRHFGEEAWRGFRRGNEITFYFDPLKYAGGSALLLAGVLRHFLAMYSSVNTFTEVVARRTGFSGEWIRWKPLAGSEVVL
jgi:type VI secretion system protein ImpG